MKTVFIFACLSLSAIGCRDEIQNSPLSADPYDRWKSYNLHNYTIEQSRICFCVDEGVQMKIIVRSDTIFSVMRLSDSTVVGMPGSQWYLPVDSLFAIIRNHGKDSIVVQYNSVYGFPESLDINPQFHAVDGGVQYVTTHIQIP